MLEKSAIREAVHCKDQFVSYLFLISKKDGRQWPVIKLKHLNTFISYKRMEVPYIKMEGLHIFKKILEQGDYLCKLNLKDAYFLFH